MRLDRTYQTRIALSIGVASLALIAFQLVIIQVLSITQWHHFAYMVVSMAMLGFGAAGTFLAIFREVLKKHIKTVLPVCYALGAVSMAGTTWLTGLLGDYDAFLLFFEKKQIGLMVVSYLAYCLPFFFGGLAITLVFYDQVARIGTLYFYNLAGSALGGISAIGLFWMVSLPYAGPLLSLLMTGSAWLVTPKSILFRSMVVVSLIIPVCVMLNPILPKTSEYKPIFGATQLPDAEIIYEEFSPYGLLQLVDAPTQRYAPSLSLNYREEPPVRKVLFNNGAYLGALPRKTDNHWPAITSRNETGLHSSHILDYTTRGLPFAIKRPDNMLIVHAGTGKDVAHARHHGVRDIQAVEPHRQVVDLLTARHPEWNDSLYHQPGIRLDGAGIRNWMAKNKEASFDLIVMPVLGAFGGDSGVYALQEQFHLTLEAFENYWTMLSENGVLSITAWADHPARVGLKLPLTIRMMLDKERLEHPEKHIMAIKSWGTVTFLVGKKPFTDSERAKARNFADHLSFDPLFLSDIEPEEREVHHWSEDDDYYRHIDSLLLGNYDLLTRSYPFDIEPARDNRPFFSGFMSLKRMPELFRTYGARELPYLELGFILALVTLIQVVVASLLLIILPLFRVRWRGTRRRWTFLYFSGIGLGFMFFEIVLIQKLVLYLGNPVYATAAVLAALLLFSGFGSFFTTFLDNKKSTVVNTSGIIVILVLLYAFILMPMLQIGLAWPMAVKVIHVLLLLAPPAFFMGMMFPFGLRILSGKNESQIPWACGIDSCMSVVATALATLVAIEAGYFLVMAVSVGAYGITTVAAAKISL